MKLLNLIKTKMYPITHPIERLVSKISDGWRTAFYGVQRGVRSFLDENNHL